jgi:hypothetical protein
VRQACERFIKNAKPSSAIIHIADDSTIKATVSGDMDMFAINTPGYKGLGLGCKFQTNVTVVPDISTELLSLSELFATQGFKVTLDPNGISELYLYDDKTKVETRIPIRYDYEQKGFYVDAIMGGTLEQQKLLAARIADKSLRSSKAHHAAQSASTFEKEHLSTVTRMLQEHDDVEFLQCSKEAEIELTDDVNFSGASEFCRCELQTKPHAHRTKATKDPLILRRDLTGTNRGLNFGEAHDIFIHKGTHPDCWICKLVKGAGRREKSSDPDLRVESNRPGHTFALDICQWSHRATTGEGYTAQMVDISTGVPFGHHLVFKNDFVDVLEEWITSHRNDPLYNWMEYPFCSELYLDRDGIWDEKCAKWNDKIRKGLNIKHHYSDPDRKNTNARPENAIKELERATKSLLFSKNLPAQEWKACADQANWLNARLPYNQRSGDGDDALPLELLTNGQVSRRQIKQELSFFVPVGTPCLVWNPSVKGSALQSKVRWGISQRMSGKAVEFVCPYNHHTFVSRSFMAIKLKAGMNYYQFLGIKCPELSNAALIPALPDTPMFVTLPELAQHASNTGPPSTEVNTSNLDVKPFVHILDPAGRVFKADPNGKFHHTGRNINDNSDETKGFLKDLSDKGIIQDGWNDTPTHNREYNYQIMVLANRPRDFIGRCFDKNFLRSNGAFETHTGRIFNYNQKDAFWRVQYEDGQQEDFDAKDIIHYVIEQQTSDINTSPVSTQNFLAPPEATTSKNEPPKATINNHENAVTTGPATSDLSTLVHPRKVRFDKHLHFDDKTKCTCLQRRRAINKGDRVSTESTHFDTKVLKNEVPFSAQHPGRCHGIVLQVSRKGGVKVHWDDDQTMTVPRSILRCEDPLEHYDDTNSPEKPQLDFSVSSSISKMDAVQNGNEISGSSSVSFDTSPGSSSSSPDTSSGSSSSSIETFSCIFKAKRFQLVPKFNHLGEKAPSQDFWNDVTRRVTYNHFNNEIIEDLTIDQLAIHGGTEKLPCNVKEIRTVFYFKSDFSPADERLGRRSYVSKKGDKLRDVLNHVGIRPEHLKTYLQFTNMPSDGVILGSKQPRKLLKAFCKPGILFEAPHGNRWVQLLNAYHARSNKANPAWKVAKMTEQAVEEEQEMLRTCSKLNLTRDMGHDFAARKAHAYCAVQLAAKRHVTFQQLTTSEKLIKISKAMKSATPTAKDPSNIFEALASDQAQDWIHALLNEEAPLDSLGVFLHDQSPQQLKDLGITAKYIIPSRYVIAVKRHPDRTIDKLKVRRVIQGHKWAMQRGVHYDESFTASPTQDTTRLLQALSIGHGWTPYCFDVKCAYQNAPATGPKLAIKYPKGFERRNANGEELCAVLQANLQGKADAGRQWGKFRDDWIMKIFNKEGWKCKQSIRDPCLFTITCPEGEITHMVCYTDDCDCHTTSMESVLKVAAKFEAKFGIKVVNPEFMLGVKRKRYHREGVLHAHLSQEEYIEELYESFKKHMSDQRRPQNLPFPKGKRLYVGCEDPEEGETEANIEKGYMRLCGALLWCARNTMPSIAYAISQLCRMMSAPTNECFELALQTLQFAYDNRHLGIVFRSDGNAAPATYYDASFNPDPNDGKSQYGFSTNMYGGPVSWISKKLKHVGTHVGQNETMSQTFAAKNSTWVFFLLEEIDQGLENPIDLFGDNDQSNRLGQENMMTSCNKYYWP